MAEYLIRRWRLSALRVQFDLSRRVPVVVSTLVVYTDGTPRTLWSLEHNPESYGVPDEGVPTQLTLPDDLVDAVQVSFTEQLTEETALWLRLEPPYGYLGGAPWEQVLVERLRRPVLRVPDRLPVVADFGSVWRTVVVVSATPGSEWAPDYLERFVLNLDGLMPYEHEVHVFADAYTSERTVDLARQVPCWKSHTLRMPGGAPSWATWIHEGLEGAAVRTLHVVTDADFDYSEPMLLLPPDPRRPNTARRFVSIDPLLRLTDALGAGTLSFGSPAENRSDLATRMLADRVGQTRPGATLYSDMAADPDGRTLASAHAYLADRHRDLPLPFHPSLFLYVQPEHIQSHLLEDWPEPVAGSTSPGDEILPAMPALTEEMPAVMLAQQLIELAQQLIESEAAETPGWLAASRRYLTNSWVQLARTSAGPDGDSSERSAYHDGAAEALVEIAAILKRHS